MKKAVLVLGLMVVFMFAFAACGDDESGSDTSSSASVHNSAGNSSADNSSADNNSADNNSSASSDIVNAIGSTITLGNAEFGTTGAVSVSIDFKKSDGTFTGTANTTITISGSYTKAASVLKLTFNEPATAQTLVDIEGTLSVTTGGTATFSDPGFSGVLTLGGDLPDYP